MYVIVFTLLNHLSHGRSHGAGGGGQYHNVLAVLGHVQKLSAILDTRECGISYDDYAMAYDVTRYRS